MSLLNTALGYNEDKLGCPCKKKLKELVNIGLGSSTKGLGTPGIDEPIIIRVKIVDKNFYPVKNLTILGGYKDADTHKFVANKGEVYKTDHKGLADIDVYMFAEFKFLINNQHIPISYEGNNNEELIANTTDIYHHSTFQVEGLEINKNTGEVLNLSPTAKAIKLSDELAKNIPVYEIGNTATPSNTGGTNTPNTEGTATPSNTGGTNTPNTEGTATPSNKGDANTPNTESTATPSNTADTATLVAKNNEIFGFKPIEIALIVTVSLVAGNFLFNGNKESK